MQNFFTLSEINSRHTVQLKIYIVDRKAFHPALKIILCPRLMILEMSLFDLLRSLGRQEMGEKRQYGSKYGLCTVHPSFTLTHLFIHQPQDFHMTSPRALLTVSLPCPCCRLIKGILSTSLIHMHNTITP